MKELGKAGDIRMESEHLENKVDRAETDACRHETEHVAKISCLEWVTRWYQFLKCSKYGEIL